MRTIPIIKVVLLWICMLVLSSCNPPWQDHYGNQEEQVDIELWDAISQEPRYATFVEKMEAAGLDSIFHEGLVHTLFVPTNEAFETLPDSGYELKTLLQYHILPTLFMDKSVTTWRKLQTYSGKYMLIEKQFGGYFADGIPMEAGSPLYLDGKYYELPRVVVPKPSLYELTAQYSPILRDYIDSKDSIFLDRSLSTPVGFDEQGRTIYDSVFGVVNLFEEEFFPISQEFRDENATFILFSQEQYEQALDDMAQRLGGDMTGHEDIPFKWQNDVLLPEVTSSAMFEGILSYSDLQVGKIRSITGDTVFVEAENIDPDSRLICSNGVSYLYDQFSIHDTLFRGTETREGESMIYEIGAGKYAWKEDIVVTGAVVSPDWLNADAASEGALVNVNLGREFDGEYIMEFTFKNLFPMRYRLEWRANSRPSGVFAVYVNDQVLEYSDKFGNIYTEFDTNDLKQSIISVTGERFLSEEGFNIRDYWVEHLTSYGDVTVRFEFLGSGDNATDGFNIDYIKLIPDF